MSTVILTSSIGDRPVLSGSLVRDQFGNWIAHLEIGGLAAPSGTATLHIFAEDDTDYAFVGFVRRADVDKGRSRVPITIVGGAGNLPRDLAPRDYVAAATTVPAGLVARHIAEDAGEQLADGVEDALDARPLTRWTRAEGTALEALDLLVDELGPTWVWRVQADGKIWIGEETWPAAAQEPFDQERHPEDGAITATSDGVPVGPGQRAFGHEIVETRYTLTPRSVDAELRYAVEGDPSREVRTPEVYLETHRATVIRQNDDGTLDLKVDDDRIGELSRVRFQLGAPGCKVTLPVDAEVHVAFDSGSPRGAYAFLAERDEDATKAIALVDDAIAAGTLTATAPPGGGPVTFTYTPPGGSPSVGTSIVLSGKVTGPGHKFVKGRPGP
jgi:hypothetical protein